MTAEKNPENVHDAPVDAAATARARLCEALIATGRADPRAFALVYSLTSAKLFGICLRICGDRHAAEDVMQEVYAAVWRRAAGFEPGRASPITWLSTIARNRAIDWRRAQPRIDTAPAAQADAIPDATPRADEVLLGDEADRHLHSCIADLEPHARDAIRTAFFEGTSYSELARRADVPLGTMKSWVRRGLLRLKERLDDGA